MSDNDQQPTPIKPQIVFTEQPDAKIDAKMDIEQAPNEVIQDIQHLQDQLVFDQAAAVKYEVEITDKIDQAVEAEKVEKILTSESRKWSLPAKLLAGFASLILGIETVGFFSELWLNQPIMASLYTGAFALIVGMGAKFTFAEYRHLKRLKRLQRWHNASQRMDSGEQVGEALRLCNHINKELPDNETVSQAVAQWQAALKETFTDKDVLDLYSHTVLDKIDDQALKVISRYASETSLMVAISPLAVMDMALVMWRSVKMIEQICVLYGVKLGYWSRIKLIKTVLRNVVYAGVTELIADVGAAALSLELAGKLSARAAQGLGAGLLTGRLGFKVMQLCRPVPALPNKQKRLGDLSKHLLANIKRALTDRKV